MVSWRCVLLYASSPSAYTPLRGAVPGYKDGLHRGCWIATAPLNRSPFDCLWYLPGPYQATLTKGKSPGYLTTRFARHFFMAFWLDLWTLAFLGHGICIGPARSCQLLEGGCFLGVAQALALCFAQGQWLPPRRQKAMEPFEWLEMVPRAQAKNLRRP